MTIEQIRNNLEKVEKNLLLDSLYNLNVEELVELQGEIRSLKEEFLESSFLGCEVEELDDIRFHLLETELNIAISIKEKLHEDTTEDVRRLESFYRIA